MQLGGCGQVGCGQVGCGIVEVFEILFINQFFRNNIHR